MADIIVVCKIIHSCIYLCSFSCVCVTYTGCIISVHERRIFIAKPRPSHVYYPYTNRIPSVYSIAACAALSLGRRGRPFLSLVSVSRHLPPSSLTRPYLETAMAAATPPSLGLLLCVFVCACRAFYIPGVAPTEYEEGDKLEIKV